MNKYILLMMLSLFANPALADADALIKGVKQGNVKNVAIMLDKGEDVNGANKKGNTALHYAVASENLPMVKVLLNKGADGSIKNSKGWTALMIAERQENKTIYALIEDNINHKKAQKVISAKKVKAPKTPKKANTQKADKKTTLSKPHNITANSSKITTKIAKKEAETEVSSLSSEIYKGDEEIVYCLNFLGHQGAQKSMKVASGYFAIESGVARERHDIAIELSNKYYENSSEENLRLRAKECSQIITPKKISKQNQIIRSLNKAMGYN